MYAKRWTRRSDQQCASTRVQKRRLVGEGKPTLKVNDVRVYRSAHSPNQIYVQTCLAPHTGILGSE